MRIASLFLIYLVVKIHATSRMENAKVNAGRGEKLAGAPGLCAAKMVVSQD
jgi:hypothetical protein